MKLNEVTELADKDKKRYYWLKLNENFFEEDTIQWLEEQKNGKEYSLIYLKLCLKSLKTDGLLVRNVGEFLIPFDEITIAKLTNSNVDTVIVAMNLFKKIGLVEVLENGELYLTQLSEMVGGETYSAKRKRLQRAKEKSLGTLSQPSPKNVTQSIEYRDKSKELRDNNILSNDDSQSLRSRFELIWEQYPKGRKQGKDKSFKAYQRAIKDGVTDEMILKGLSDYKKQIEIQRTELQFIKQAVTWFTNKSWNDEYVTTSKNQMVFNQATAINMEQYEYGKSNNLHTIDDLPY